ncbi:hypothetical protein CPC08DRAFT_677013 [Agrocybe pediades]|nr:hypothetical protein CPC08DRAFT_677013 [Agrocybe pediades]
MADPTDTSFIIPADIQAKMLPERSLSLLDFIKFSFPPISQSASTLTDNYFSLSPPSLVDIDTLKSLPTPSENTIKSLLQSARDSLDTVGFQSITCPHINHTNQTYHLPLWILDYWNRVLLLRPVKAKLLKAEGSLQEQRVKASTKETRDLITEVYNMLGCLSSNSRFSFPTRPASSLALHQQHHYSPQKPARTQPNPHPYAIKTTPLTTVGHF